MGQAESRNFNPELRAVPEFGCTGMLSGRSGGREELGLRVCPLFGRLARARNQNVKRIGFFTDPAILANSQARH